MQNNINKNKEKKEIKLDLVGLHYKISLQKII